MLFAKDSPWLQARQIKGGRKMDEKRKGEIAVMLLKHQMSQKGIRLTPNFKREVGNEAKAIGLHVEEVAELAEIFIRELVEETFAK